MLVFAGGYPVYRCRSKIIQSEPMIYRSGKGYLECSRPVSLISDNHTHRIHIATQGIEYSFRVIMQHPVPD